MRKQVLTRDEWLELHRLPEYMSASDAPTILGTNPYESRFTLYKRKRGELPPKETTVAMEFGHYCENFIAMVYCRETGRNVEDPGEYTVFWYNDWLFSTLDRIILTVEGIGAVTGTPPLELKKPEIYATKDWSGGDTLPHQVQLQTQMLCVDAEWGALSALCGNGQPFHADVDRDDRLIKNILAEMTEFRDRCMNGDPPEVDGSKSTAATMKALYPTDNGETVVLGPEFREKHSRREELKAEIDMAKDEKDTLTNEFKAAIGEARVGLLDGWVYTCGTSTVKPAWTVADEYGDELDECGIPSKARKGYTSRRLTRRELKG